jgi:hypothetical protein
MAYALPTWKEMQEFGGVDEDAAAAAEYQHYPEPTGYITPTDEKRFLTDYVTTLPGWNDSWTQYLPAIAGFLEETITNPRDYMPAGVWDSIINWYANAGISGEGTVDMWAGANPEPTPEAGGYNWMSSNWWQPGQGIVNTYNPPQAPTVPTPTEQNDSHKQYILQDMVNQGVAGRTPGNSNLGVAPAQLEPLKATEQPMQQFSTLNQWNTMPKWDMGAGPNWSGM